MTTIHGASKIACVNNGGFSMRVRVVGIVDEVRHCSDWTDHYPIDKTRTIDLSTLAWCVRGTNVWPEVDPAGGPAKEAADKVRFDPGAGTGTYVVTGTTLHVKITLT